MESSAPLFLASFLCLTPGSSPSSLTTWEPGSCLATFTDSRPVASIRECAFACEESPLADCTAWSFDNGDSPSCRLLRLPPGDSRATWQNGSRCAGHSPMRQLRALGHWPLLSDLRSAVGTATDLTANSTGGFESGALDLRQATVVDAPVSLFTPLGSFSLGLWLRVANTSRSMPVLDGQLGEGCYTRMWLWPVATRVNFMAVGGSSGTARCDTASDDVAANYWHFLTGVYNAGTGSASVFINSSRKACGSVQQTTIVQPRPYWGNRVTLGGTARVGPGVSAFFSGFVACFTVVDGVLDEAGARVLQDACRPF